MRRTPTHSGPDSKGVVRLGSWELEGEAYLFLVGGAVAGVLLFILTVNLWFPWRLGLSLLPLGLGVFWIRFFLVNRPPRFAADFWEGLVLGSDFHQRPQAWSSFRHPLQTNRKGF